MFPLEVLRPRQSPQHAETTVKLVNSLLSGSFLIKLFSFSSDKDRRTDSRIRRKNTAQPRRESNPGSRSSRCGFVAQWLERATRTRKILGSIPGGAALCFFV